MRPYNGDQVYACCRRCGVAPPSRFGRMRHRRALRRYGRKATRMAAKNMIRSAMGETA